MNELRQRIESQRNQRSPQSGASDFRRDLNERLNRDDIRNRMQPGNGPGNGRSDNDRSDRSPSNDLRQRLENRGDRGNSGSSRSDELNQRLRELQNRMRNGDRVTPGDGPGDREFRPDGSPFGDRNQRPDPTDRDGNRGPDFGNRPDMGDREGRPDGPRGERGDDNRGDENRGNNDRGNSDRADDDRGDGDRPGRGNGPGMGDRDGDGPGRGRDGDRDGRGISGDFDDLRDRLRDGNLDRDELRDRAERIRDEFQGRRDGPGGRDDRFNDWDRGRPGADFGGRSPGRRDFDRDWDNQVLNYLRFGNNDLIRQYVNNGRRDDFFRDRDFRVRYYDPRGRNDYWRRYHNQINFNVWGRSIARHVVRLRAAQLAGYRYDRRNYLYRDYWGRPLGVYYRDVFRPGSRFIVPHFNRNYRGSYYCYGGSYYYYPETYAMGPSTVTTSEPVEMDYGGFDYVGDLAHRFERMTNDICLEMHYNYRGNPEFDQVYRDAYMVLTAAKEIEQAAERGDQQAAADLLYGLDQLFYYVYDQAATWERNEQKQIGDGDLMAKFSITEALLQHLMYNVGVEPSFDVVDEAAPQPTSEPPAAGSIPSPQFPAP